MTANECPRNAVGEGGIILVDPDPTDAQELVHCYIETTEMKVKNPLLSPIFCGPWALGPVSLTLRRLGRRTGRE